MSPLYRIELPCVPMGAQTAKWLVPAAEKNGLDRTVGLRLSSGRGTEDDALAMMAVLDRHHVAYDLIEHIATRIKDQTDAR